MFRRQSQNPMLSQRMQRLPGIVLGVATQILFGVTVWYLFHFLKGPRFASGRTNGLVVDALLALQFAIIHSLLLLPSVRERLARSIPSAFYGCFYCIATCASLLVMFTGWKRSSTVIWQFSSSGRTLVEIAFIASWFALFYSLSLTGLGYQTGLTPWWHWVRRRPQPPRAFNPRGAYRWLRHPIYLSFLGLVWFTPLVTADRLILILAWTLYIGVGSCLKDRRLVYYLGDQYRRYQAVVPGYPGFWFGPLGKLSFRPRVKLMEELNQVDHVAKKAA